MALSLRHYTITITNSISNAAPSDGFVDPTTIERYYGYNAYASTNYYSSAATPYAFETTPTGLTLALCAAKRRGNHRYNEIIRQLELISNISIDPITISAPGGSVPGWTPTSLTFTMVSQISDEAWSTPDESTPGAVLLGLTAMQRCVARALVADHFRVAPVFDPTASTAPGNNTASVVRYGTRINVASSFEIGPYASSLAAATAVITVTKLH